MFLYYGNLKRLHTKSHAFSYETSFSYKGRQFKSHSHQFLMVAYIPYNFVIPCSVIKYNIFQRINMARGMCPHSNTHSSWFGSHLSQHIFCIYVPSINFLVDIKWDIRALDSAHKLHMPHPTQIYSFWSGALIVNYYYSQVLLLLVRI